MQFVFRCIDRIKILFCKIIHSFKVILGLTAVLILSYFLCAIQKLGLPLKGVPNSIFHH